MIYSESRNSIPNLAATCTATIHHVERKPYSLWRWCTNSTSKSKNYRFAMHCILHQHSFDCEEDVTLKVIIEINTNLIIQVRSISNNYPHQPWNSTSSYHPPWKSAEDRRKESWEITNNASQKKKKRMTFNLKLSLLIVSLPQGIVRGSSGNIQTKGVILEKPIIETGQDQ